MLSFISHLPDLKCWICQYPDGLRKDLYRGFEGREVWPGAYRLYCGCGAAFWHQTPAALARLRAVVGAKEGG